jgi:hypothetical protein
MACRHTALALLMLATACAGGAPDEETTPDAVAVEDTITPPADGVPPEFSQVPVSFDTAAARGERPLLREVYYWRGTARDPFRALFSVDQGGPELADLTLTSVIYQASDPSRSLAVFREIGNNDRHTVRQGDRIGRLYVATIAPDMATLTMNDFGTVRRQTYQLRRPGTP